MTVEAHWVVVDDSLLFLSPLFRQTEYLSVAFVLQHRLLIFLWTEHNGTLLYGIDDLALLVTIGVDILDDWRKDVWFLFR